MLVVRSEADGIRRYCHFGTGNYNPATATVYEDVGLLSGDPELAADLANLFNHLTGYSNGNGYRQDPRRARWRAAPAARADPGGAGGGGRADRDEDEQPRRPGDHRLRSTRRIAAGAEIDLIVRGICCLRPGVTGLSERIRVRSIVGRFLEHSRIFRFGSDARGPRYYIGSADLMARNLDRRVECVAPVNDPALTPRLEEILTVNLADDVLAWELAADGWQKVPTKVGVNAHERLQASAFFFFFKKIFFFFFFFFF